MIIAHCPACGQSNVPNAKFCRHCGISLAGASQPVPVPVSTPTPLPEPPVCRSCGKIVAPEEKFCEYCGAPPDEEDPVVVNIASVPSSFPCTCPACGTAMGPEMKFCVACGAPMTAEAAPEDAAPWSPSLASIDDLAEDEEDFAADLSRAGGTETVIGVIGNAKKRKKMIGVSYDTYTLVITSRRMIFTRLTPALANAAIMDAQAKAKAEGREFLGTVQDRLAASFEFALRYEKMTPDQVLVETPGNKAIENSRISAIKMQLTDSGNTYFREFRTLIESRDGKFEYLIAEDERFTNLLKTVYGDRLHLLSGYFSKTGVRIPFF